MMPISFPEHRHVKTSSIDKQTVLDLIRATHQEKEFESLFPGKTEELASELAWIYDNLLKVFNHPDQSKIANHQIAAGVIGWKAANTALGAVEICRKGYYTDAVALLRNVIETLAVILHLHQQPELQDTLVKGEHDARGSIKHAKKFISVIGSLYGLLCEFNHLTQFSMLPGFVREQEKITGFFIGGGFQKTQTKQKLLNRLHIFQIELVLQIFRCVIERVFRECVSDFNYWVVAGDRIALGWSPEVTEKWNKCWREVRTMQEAGYKEATGPG